MSTNGFGLSDEDFNKLRSDTSYFRGRVITELMHIKKELTKQEEKDNVIFLKLEKLPCEKNKNKITYALLLIAVLFLLLGYAEFPLIMKFFGI